MPAETKHKAPAPRSEQIILFRCGSQLLAVSSASVQEVRSVDSLSGAAMAINEPGIPKVRHSLRRDDRLLYVVNGSLHFGLKPTPAALIFLMRASRIALLIDSIEKMTTMTRLQALPLSFCNEERTWYRGLTVLEQSVIPVINPGGFLTDEELLHLDVNTANQLPPLESSTPSMEFGA